MLVEMQFNVFPVDSMKDLKRGNLLSAKWLNYRVLA